jgi:hypothetical protein
MWVHPHLRSCKYEHYPGLDGLCRGAGILSRSVVLISPALVLVVLVLSQTSTVSTSTAGHTEFSTALVPDLNHPCPSQHVELEVSFESFPEYQSCPFILF